MKKKILPYLLLPMAFVAGQQNNGTKVSSSQLKVSTINSVPTQVVTTVSAGTPNSFPIPSGKTVCIVSRNIPQSPGIDYNVIGTAIVFISTPEIGDNVLLSCF